MDCLLYILELRSDELFPRLDVFRAVSEVVTGKVQTPARDDRRGEPPSLVIIDRPEANLRVRVSNRRSWWIAVQNPTESDALAVIEDQVTRARETLHGARIARLGVRTHWVQRLPVDDLDAAGRLVAGAFLRDTSLAPVTEAYDCAVVHEWTVPDTDGKRRVHVEIGPMQPPEIVPYLPFPDGFDLPPFSLWVDIDYGISDFGAPNTSAVMKTMKDVVRFAEESADSLSRMLDSRG